MKKLLACLAALTLASPVPVSAESFDFPTNAVVQVRCSNGLGSAFHIGGGVYVTAAHVVYGCAERLPVSVIDEENDYALLIGPSNLPSVTVRCDGFKTGDTYVGVGFPGDGGGYQAREPLIAADYRPDGWQSFIGNLYPGMSGGVVLNRAGEAVGIVNMRWPSRSLDLSKTILCKD